MEKFSWKGIDLQGANCKGITEAISTIDLKNRLLKQNIALINCKKSKNSFLSQSFSQRLNITLSQKASFFEELSILMNSGVELIQSLKLVIKEIKNKKFTAAINNMINDIENGNTFSSALKKYDSIFDPTIIQSIKAGEHSGKLAFVLKYISNYLNSKIKLRRKLKSAATMPMITLTFAFIIFLGIFIFVIPQFQTLFSSMEKEIPRSTQILLNISLFLKTKAFLFFSLGFLCLILVLKNLLPQKTISTIKSKISPSRFLFNKISARNNLISFLNTLSLLLKSGIPLKQSLDITIKTLPDNIFKKKAIEVTQDVTAGKTFAASLKSKPKKYFPEKLSAFVFIGEQSGNLDTMLEKSANIFQDQLNRKINLLTSLFQPILIIFVGILVAFIMFTVYLPLFNVANLF